MSKTSAEAASTEAELRESWLPMVIIAMGQAQMSLNINALPVSIGGIVAEFNTAPTTIGTAIVANSIAVAGFTMLGAKLGQKFGSLNVFRVGTVVLLNVLVTHAPKQFAGDVGSLRGTIKSLAAGVGTAVAGALAVGILSVNVERSLVDNPAVPPELIRQVDLDRATFVSNERLKDVMTSTTATALQIAEAVRINADARLRALKLSFLILAGVALLVIVPVGRLPGHLRSKGPGGEPSKPDALGP